MSQRFNPRIEEMKQNNPASSGYEPETQIRDKDVYYPTHGNVRDICFVLLSGRMISLNYSYLIAKDINEERTEITLDFTSHKITICGINLEPAFFKLMTQEIRLLQCTDVRYNSIGGDRAIVNSIQVTANVPG